MARAKEFDEDAVLFKAMKLFWEQGYEKTSINDLIECMGIHRRSLYDTFGDKHKLYLTAIDRYSKLVNSELHSGLLGASPTQAIGFMFDFMIEGVEDSPPGCLFVNMAVELASRDGEVETKVNDNFTKSEQLLTGIIQKGKQSGEFTSSLKAEELAESLHNMLLGLRVLARTSTDKKKLYRIANVSKKILDK
ncbi:TetR/AcrR family transcriptional repressor of nem operon [Paenibacillus endophyticus]|uniref:TetR/AcrR family transcriptional repressor of nem operon n=1 Tax=Paenibacillus endophyticus TaxID=1294268 RepID=A0A7W5C647_9BACL|nr:TetR/AcrR family transcriptional regulator [Paenibacillus endophyticus]MBB3151738.1 TetR/AcrR family transcriptional repressor of nem operon [Paenibacillus endophyticus]